MTLLSVFKLHIDGILILLQHFSQQYDYEIYLCKCMEISFTNFNCCKELRCKNRLQLIHQFCYWWTFEIVSNSTVITNCATMNIVAYVSWFMYAQFLKGIFPGVELLENAMCIWSCIFPKGFFNLLSDQVCGSSHHSLLVNCWHWDFHQSY